MILRERLPNYDPESVYDGTADEREFLTTEEQTIIIELSIMNGFMLEQIIMPMTSDGLGGAHLTACFQRLVNAEILTFFNAGLITRDFFDAHNGLLDPLTGIRQRPHSGVRRVARQPLPHYEQTPNIYPRRQGERAGVTGREQRRAKR